MKHVLLALTIVLGLLSNASGQTPGRTLVLFGNDDGYTRATDPQSVAATTPFKNLGLPVIAAKSGAVTMDYDDANARQVEAVKSEWQRWCPTCTSIVLIAVARTKTAGVSLPFVGAVYRAEVSGAAHVLNTDFVTEKRFESVAVKDDRDESAARIQSTVDVTRQVSEQAAKFIKAKP